MAERTTQRRIANRYILQTPLGRGGMGVVWRAEDTLLAREVAIKEVQLPPALADAELASMRARVLREARAAARLNHPGAVTLFDVVQEEGHTFIVMELVEAPTLAQVVRERGPLAPDRVAAIGLEVLDALRAAHRVGIVHRDVKPGNVMVRPGDARAKLADFGIASLAGDPQLTSTGLVLGSPAYMAPEQANGKPSGPATDLWALGATMYYAVEGEPPFDREGTIPTLTAVVNDPPRPMRRAGALAPVIAALLAKSPAERPSAGQLQGQLERVLDVGDEPTAAHPTVPLPADAPPAEDAHEQTAQLPAVVPVPVPAPAAAEPTAAPPPAPEAPPPTPGPAAAEPEPVPVVADAPAPATAGGPEPAAAGAPAPAVVRDLRPASLSPGPELPAVTPRRSRRGLLLAGVALLAVVGVLAATWLPGVVGGGRQGASPPATTAGAQAPSTTRSSSTSAPSTTGKAATSSQPASSAPAAQGVPAGWQLSRFPDRGFAVAVPADWKESQSRLQANFRDPRRDRNFFVQSKQPANDLQAAGQVWERHIRDQHGKDGLQVVSKGFGTFQGKRAYIFEYTYQDKGERVHERDVNVAINGWGYSLVLHAQDGDWGAAQQEVWQGVERSFQSPG